MLPAPPRSLIVAFLALEVVMGAAWWLVLAWQPEYRAPFFAPDLTQATLIGLAAADVTLFVGGAAITAWGTARHARWARGALLIHTGAALYATLFTIGHAATAPSCWLGATLMLPIAGVLLWFCIRFESEAA